jgi:hypothetical protein
MGILEGGNDAPSKSDELFQHNIVIGKTVHGRVQGFVSDPEEVGHVE